MEVVQIIPILSFLASFGISSVIQVAVARSQIRFARSLAPVGTLHALPFVVSVLFLSKLPEVLSARLVVSFAHVELLLFSHDFPSVLTPATCALISHCF